MKTSSALALLLAATSIAPAFAQSNGVQAQIPFAFTISGTTLQAGTYLIHSGSGGSQVLSMLDRTHGGTILMLGAPGDSWAAKEDVLVFHQYGNQYFLREIRTRNSSMNYDFSETKAEKQARTVVEEAKLPTAAPVLIALR